MDKEELISLAEKIKQALNAISVSGYSNLRTLANCIDALTELEKKIKDLDQQEVADAKSKIEWMKETVMHVVISTQKGDDERFKKYGLDFAVHKKAMESSELDKEFKDEDNPFRVVFVCAM